MKKLILLGILSLFLISLFALSASAQNICPFPFPVWGKIDFFGEKIKGLPVEITTFDFRGNEQASWVTNTNEHGEYSTDLCNYLCEFRGCWLQTEIVKIKGCDSFAECIQEYNIGAEEVSVVRSDFKFKEGEVKVIVTDDTTVIYKEKPVYVCPDGSVVVSDQLCPEVIPIETIKVIKDTKYICPDGTEVKSKENCPAEEGISDLYKALIAIAIIILGVFGWGPGFTALANYYYKKGKELEKQGKKAEAKKYYNRAGKMLATALKRAKEGKYKKS